MERRDDSCVSVYGLIGLENVYNRVPREILKWELMKKGIPKVHVNLIEYIYEGTSTRVKSLCEEETWNFSVRVRVHQVLALGPYLYSLIVMNEITKDVQDEVSWCMLFIHDIMLLGKGPGDVNGIRLEEWREPLEGKGLKISKGKTEYIK